MKAIVSLLFMGLIFALSACAPAPAAEEIPARDWKMSVVTGEDSSWTKGAHLFADLVRERTGGKIQISVYPNGELAGGNQVKELTMLQDGTINFTYHSNLLYTNLDQSFAAVSMPWLFADYAAVDAVLSGPAGVELLRETEDYGIIGLSFGENGFRQLTNSKRAVSTPEDLIGLKIRIPGVDLYDSVYKALGAVPLKMNFGEVAAALKQGQIDGQENPIDIIVSSRLYEVQKHITIWNYSYDALILGMNKTDWEGLPASSREIIKLSAIEASKEQIKLSREAARTRLDLLREKGMTVTELTTDQLKEFQAKTAPVYTEWSDKVGSVIKSLQGGQGG